MSDYLNKNGLEAGRIPANSSCPFIDKCKVVKKECPTLKNTKEKPFYCGLARLFSLYKIEENSGFYS